MRGGITKACSAQGSVPSTGGSSVPRRERQLLLLVGVVDGGLQVYGDGVIPKSVGPASDSMCPRRWLMRPSASHFAVSLRSLPWNLPYDAGLVHCAAKEEATSTPATACGTTNAIDPSSPHMLSMTSKPRRRHLAEVLRVLTGGSVVEKRGEGGAAGGTGAAHKYIVDALQYDREICNMCDILTRACKARMTL